MNAKEFRQQWSHKPTPIQPEVTGLWYSEECTEQLMAAFAAYILEMYKKEVEKA